MDETIGYISLNNINKLSEYVLPNVLIFFGVFISFFYCNYYLKKNSISFNFFNYEIFSFEKILRLIYFYITFYFILYYFGINTFYLYSAPLVCSFISEYRFNFLSDRFKKIIVSSVSFCLLIIFCFSQSNNYPVFLIIFAIYSVVLFKCGSLFFSFAVLILSTKSFFVGPTIVGDAFHLAEYFLASSQFFSGFFNVFPNIGYLEELPGYFLIRLLEVITFGHFQISIGTGRTLIWAALLPVLMWYPYKRSKFLSALFALSIPLDRISLLISLVYGLLISVAYQNKEYKTFCILVSILPYIFLGLSPSYALIPILALIIIFPFQEINLKIIFFVIFSWIIILFISNDLIRTYITTYLDFNSNFNIGFSTSLSVLPFKDLIFWPIFTLVVAIVIGGVSNNHTNILINILKSIISIILLLKFVSYGYGRVDPGFSRLLPLGIALLYISFVSSKSFKPLIACTLFFILILYSNINFIKNVNFTLNNNKDPIISLDGTNHIIVNKINNFADGRYVINYSNEPSLSFFINNSLIPPFTSPYVTLGTKPQNDVLNFIKSHKDAIIYIGHSFFTFDGVDVRLRVPIVFKYLAEKYTYFNYDGNIYAVPNISSDIPTSFNIFFNSLDIKKSALFYINNKKNNTKYRDVFVDCSQYSSGRFKIWAEHNFIYGDLNCGTNIIPDIFLIGDIKKIEKM